MLETLIKKYHSAVRGQVPNVITSANIEKNTDAEEWYIASELDNRSVILRFPVQHKEPMGIDVLFSLHDSQKQYAMYLTDIDDDILQDTFNDLTSNAMNFLQGHYRTSKRKGLFGKAWEYIDIESSDITPSTANLVESKNK